MRRFALTIAALLASAATAHATVVTIDFAGLIVPGAASSVDGFNVGDAYSASFSYDTTATPSGGGGFATYSILGATFTDGATTIDFTDLADSVIGIENDAGGDAVYVSAYVSLFGLRLDFNATAPQDSVFSSTDLPTSLDLSAFTLTPDLYDGEGAVLDLSVATPEPATMLVLGTGLLGLGLVRRRR